jgi:Ion transport protein
MRILRITRIVKLAGKNKGLQALMSTITLSVTAILNAFCLLMLCLFIFSVLGNFFFGNIKEGNYISDYRNFTNWG